MPVNRSSDNPLSSELFWEVVRAQLISLERPVVYRVSYEHLTDSYIVTFADRNSERKVNLTFAASSLQLFGIESLEDFLSMSRSLESQRSVPTREMSGPTETPISLEEEFFSRVT